MKEKLKEKIIKESQGVGAADMSPPPTENFGDGVRHSVPHCARVGRVAGVALPKGLADSLCSALPAAPQPRPRLGHPTLSKPKRPHVC